MKPFQSTSELADMCGLTYRKMLYFLKQTSLWDRALCFNGTKRYFLITDIQNECPRLWDSILMSLQLNQLIEEQDQDE